MNETAFEKAYLEMPRVFSSLKFGKLAREFGATQKETGEAKDYLLYRKGCKQIWKPGRVRSKMYEKPIEDVRNLESGNIKENELLQAIRICKAAGLRVQRPQTTYEDL